MLATVSAENDSRSGVNPDLLKVLLLLAQRLFIIRLLPFRAELLLTNGFLDFTGRLLAHLGQLQRNGVGLMFQPGFGGVAGVLGLLQFV